jgi:apolipoprotein N-acyltransferase
MFENQFTQLSHRIILSWGWKRRIIAFLAGASLVLAMPPISIFPALCIGFTIAIWLIDGSSGGTNNSYFKKVISSAITGWWFGFGYFLGGLWWLGAAFLTEGEQFIWAMPLGVIGLPAVLALFHAFGFALARMMWSNSAGRIFAFAAGLGLAEWLRGHILTGFPWNTFGQAFIEYIVTAQFASLVGVEGLSVLALILMATPAFIATGITSRAKYKPLIWASFVFLLILVFGGTRLALNGGLNPQLDKAHLVENVKLRVMQPNISMFEKHNAKNGEKLIETYLKLSDKATSASTSSILDTTHVIWPESSFPFLLAQTPQALNLIAAKLQGKVTLITGAIRADLAGTGQKNQHYFNSIQVVAKDGVISDSYDKVHLVPFGEYLPAPFQTILIKIGLRKFVHTPGDFEAGSLLRSISAEGLPPILPMICYEAIFPREFTRDLVPGTSAPKLIINVTNDAWFGNSFGPYQHFSMSKTRAIEQGLPLIRSANTGISAIIDPYGRILKSLPVGVADVIDAPLPKAIEMTIYLSYGKSFVTWLLLICAIIAIFSSLRYRNIN